MLTDLYGFYKRSVVKMSEYQIKKELSQIKQIEKLLQDKLRRVI